MRTQRILLSLGMIVFVGALAAGATGAFFSDTETSTGNTFAAGEIDLKIDNTSYGFDWNRPGAVDPTGVWGANEANSWSLRDLDKCGSPEAPVSCVFFNFTDLKPGDYGEDTISVHVQNDAWACMAMNLTGTPENNVNEAEAQGLPVDTTAGANEGELQKYLNFVFWKDDGDNVYEQGETILFQGGAGELDGTWKTIADSEGTPLPANGEGEASYVGKFWCFGTIGVNAQPDNGLTTNGAPTETTTGFTCDGSGNNNDAQTDGINVDVEFYAVQARHNGQFLCSSLNRGEEPQTATVTLDKVVQFTQASVVGVDVNDFELHLVGPGGDHILVDQVAMPGLTPGEYTVSEIYSNDPAGIQFNGSFSGSCTEIGDTGEATMTVVAGVNPVCTITNLVQSST